MAYEPTLSFHEILTKVNNAKDLNVKVITQDEWIKMLNKTS